MVDMSRRTIFAPACVALQKRDVIYVPSAKRKSDLLASPLLYLLSRLIPQGHHT
jgi:hypothetical protein